MPALPITLLTGFLGSGKTTLVNHLLSAADGRKLGVIVNEFGALGVDAALIVGADGPVIELANGCICCATSGDLRRALHGTLAAGRDLDGLVIETSGLADPGPIAEVIETKHFARELRLDGIVTVIDAVNFDDNLEHAEAAYQQIALGDLLVINKTDLVDAQTPGLIAAGVTKLNPAARVVTAERARVPLDVLTGLDRKPGTRRDHHVHDDFTSAALTLDRPVDPERFDAWLGDLPRNVIRAKGFVRLAGRDHPYVVHLVGARRSAEAAPSGVAVAGAELVLIGRDLPVETLQTGLERCAA